MQWQKAISSGTDDMNIAEALHSTREKEGGGDWWDYIIEVPFAPRSCSELCFLKCCMGKHASFGDLWLVGLAVGMFREYRVMLKYYKDVNHV